MRGLGSEADEVALGQAMDLVSEKEFDLAEEHVSDFLARVSEHVLREGPVWLEREQARLDGVTLRPAEHLVQDALATLDGGRPGRDVGDDLYRGDGTRRAVGLCQEVCEAEPEVAGHALQAAEGDAAAAVLDVGEGGGGDADVPSLLAQGPSVLLTKTSDAVADDCGRVVVRLLRRDTPDRTPIPFGSSEPSRGSARVKAGSGFAAHLERRTRQTVRRKRSGEAGPIR